MCNPDFGWSRFWQEWMMILSSSVILISPDFDQSRFWSHVVPFLCAGDFPTFETILQWKKSPFVHHHFAHTQCSWLRPPLSSVQWSRRIQLKTCIDEWLLQFPHASHHTRSWEGRPPPGKDSISKSQQGWFGLTDDWFNMTQLYGITQLLCIYSISKLQIFCFYLIVKRKKKTRRQARKDFIQYTTTVMSQAPEPPKQKQTNKQTNENKQTNKQTNGTTSQHHKPCLWFISTWVQGRCKIWYDMASKTRGATYAPRWHHGALYHVTCKTLYILWECVTTFRTESLGFEALPGEESQWQMGSLQRDRGPGLQHTRMHIHSYLPEVKR